MNGYSAILAALIHRNTTGEGQKIETSLLEGEVAFLANVGLDYLMFGNIPQKWGSEHPQAVPYKAFETNDGWLVIGAAIQNLYEKFIKKYPFESTRIFNNIKTEFKFNNIIDLLPYPDEQRVPGA